MTISGLHVLVHPGDGIVAAFGSVVFTCLPTTASQQHSASELLALVERTAAGDPAPGRAIANAAAVATGKRFHALPLTPERVLRAMLGK